MVIVISFEDQVVGSHLNHIRNHDGHPALGRHPMLSKRYGLRPSRIENIKNLHHARGHQLLGRSYSALTREVEGINA